VLNLGRPVRRSLRSPLQRAVTFWWTNGDEESRQGEGRSRDVSEHGAFVFAPVCPPVGTSVVLTIDREGIPNEIGVLPVDVKCEVLRVEPPTAEWEAGGFAIQIGTNDDRCYLKPNVMIEPLVDGWYAWAHLIPPATAARNLTERHLKIMESYIETPESHQAAVKNPTLLGGPFMDLGENRVDDVRDLRERTLHERSQLVRLSGALERLDALLREKATGFSLEALYAEVPEELQGYVELVYDLNNHPSFRLIEPLLYKSPYYDESLQSVMLSEIRQDDRPFVLSTPRIDSNGSVQVGMPFASEQLDKLFRMKNEPFTLREIRHALGLNDLQAERFAAFLTTEKPRPYSKYKGEGARWRYFGHACILLETPGVTVLTDPVLSYTYESDISRYTYEDLPEVIDYAVITHNHQDHILFETLLQLRHRIRNIVVPRNGGGALQDPSLRLLLKQCGFQNVIELAEMEEILFERGSITAVPFLGEHGDLNVLTKSAYLLRVNDHTLMFAADSCNISPKLYEHVHKQIGDVEALFVGMECDGAPVSWIYGPLLTQRLERPKDLSRRLAGSNYERALALVDQFHCKEVYVYAMGQEPWLNHVMSIKYTDKSNPIIHSDRLIKTCITRGIKAERLFGEKEILLPYE
jgi:L-ascorbate metabolism protein UlaG (beta-lactamase superfamily)